MEDAKEPGRLGCRGIRPGAAALTLAGAPHCLAGERPSAPAPSSQWPSAGARKASSGGASHGGGGCRQPLA